MREIINERELVPQFARRATTFPLGECFNFSVQYGINYTELKGIINLRRVTREERTVPLLNQPLNL